MMKCKPIKLPASIKRQVSKLPVATQSVISQQLRGDPRPPIIYEDAIRLLAQVCDIDMAKSFILAAEGLAFWGKVHADNRAIINAQKIKVHALRQMFLCAKLLGDPRKVLRDRRIPSNQVETGENLASFASEEEIDEIIERHAATSPPNHLVGKASFESPRFQGIRAENLRRREAASQELPPLSFLVLRDRLLSIDLTLGRVTPEVLSSLSPNNTKRIRELLVSIAGRVDEIERRLPRGQK
jgi:hypothetical protein